MSDFDDMLKKRLTTQLAGLKWTEQRDPKVREFAKLCNFLTNLLLDLAKLKEIRRYFKVEFGVSLTESRCQLAAKSFLTRETGNDLPDYCGACFLIFSEVERLAKKKSKARTKKKIELAELLRGINEKLPIKKSQIRTEAFDDVNKSFDSDGNEVGPDFTDQDYEDLSSSTADATADEEKARFDIEPERRWLEQTIIALKNQRERLPTLMNALTTLDRELTSNTNAAWRTWADVWDSATETLKRTENVELSWGSVVSETTEVLLSGELDSDTRELVVDTLLNVLRDCYDQLIPGESEKLETAEAIKIESLLEYLSPMLSAMFQSRVNTGESQVSFAQSQLEEFCAALGRSSKVVAVEVFEALRESDSNGSKVDRFDDSILSALIMFALVTDGEVHQEFAGLLNVATLPVNDAVTA